MPLARNKAQPKRARNRAQPKRAQTKAQPKRSGRKAEPKSFATVVRDAVTGRFLPKSAAKSRSKATITERIRPGRRRKSK